MRATIVLAAVACLAALGPAQASRPTAPPAKAAPEQPVDKAEPPPLAPAVKALAGRLEDPAIQVPQLFQLGVSSRQGRVVFHVNGEAIRFEPRSPLIEGAYAEALKALDEARNALQSASEPDAAFAALDAVTKALMDARAALWKLKEAEKKQTKPAAVPPVPPVPPKKDG